jgi:hypothetical protein
LRLDYRGDRTVYEKTNKSPRRSAPGIEASQPFKAVDNEHLLDIFNIGALKSVPTGYLARLEPD